jgi:hypothetical protein
MARDVDLAALKSCLQNYREIIAAKTECGTRDDRLRSAITFLEVRIASLKESARAADPAVQPPTD